MGRTSIGDLEGPVKEHDELEKNIKACESRGEHASLKVLKEGLARIEANIVKTAKALVSERSKRQAGLAKAEKLESAAKKV